LVEELTLELILRVECARIV